jgi:Transglycosylase SLT domain
VNRARLLLVLGLAVLVVPTITYPPVQQAARRVTAPARGVRPPAPEAVPPGLRRFSSQLFDAATRHGLPVQMLIAISLQETRNSDPRAFRQEPVPSWISEGRTLDAARREGWTNQALSASYGLMQLLGATAWGLGYRGTATGLYDPKTNLEFGARYFAALVKRYAKQDGSRYYLALIHYNGGGTAVTRLLRGDTTPATVYAAAVLKRFEAIKRGAFTEAAA